MTAKGRRHARKSSKRTVSDPRQLQRINSREVTRPISRSISSASAEQRLPLYRYERTKRHAREAGPSPIQSRSWQCNSSSVSDKSVGESVSHHQSRGAFAGVFECCRLVEKGPGKPVSCRGEDRQEWNSSSSDDSDNEKNLAGMRPEGCLPRFR